MTGTDTGFHDKANGAFFPLVHGMELRRVQRRFLASLLRQPGVVPTVLTTGIGPDDFPEEWRHAFIMAMKQPGRAKQIVADPNGDPTIRHLYTHQIVLFGHGRARQMAEQIVASIRRRDAAPCPGDDYPSGTNNLTDGDAEPEQQPKELGANTEHSANGHDGIRADDDEQNKDVGSNDTRCSHDTNDPPESATKGGNESWRKDAEQVLPEEPAPDRLIDPDLIQMNKKYAVVRIGGKTRVVWFEEAAAYPGCKVPVFSTISDFCAFHAKRKKFVIGKDGRERKIGIGKWWINHDRRRQFSGLVYAPSVIAKTTNGKLNLWNGFGCKPRTGKCDRYLAHLRDNICCGNEEHADYLLNWMAYAVQHPDRQGEVAVVMRGKEGTGKGVAAKQFGQLLGSHFRHIVHAKHLTGHFNAHLQQCSVLFADEAFFAGDRSHESILKALITEETLLIEPKGIDPFAARNCVHLIMSSNSDWVIPAGADARRYFVLNVADSHMQDHLYFAAIAHEMDNGGREALLHYLLSRDLMGFNIRLVPQTKALAEQKTHSRRGVDRLIELICHEGVIPFAHETYSDIAITSGEERGEGFYYAARSLVPDFRYVSSIVISQALKEHWECVPWKAGNRRGIKFPPLGRLRELFDKRHGEQKWPVLAGETDEWSPRSSYDNSRDMCS
jgi:hypothetical protein